MFRKNDTVTVIKIKTNDIFIRRYYGEKHVEFLIKKTGQVRNVTKFKGERCYIIDFYNETGWSDNFFFDNELRLATKKEREKFRRDKEKYEAMEVARKI
jgi:hypothetical protein